MKRLILTSVTIPLFFMGYSYAATPVDLSHQPVSLLQKYSPSSSTRTLREASFTAPTDQMEELSRSVDFNQTTHIRVQQTHAGIPVWGADAVIHVPKAGKTKKTMMAVASDSNPSDTSMNGTFYQDLNADLANTPQQVFNPAQEQQARDQAIKLAAQTYGSTSTAQNAKAQMIVYLDKNNKAHYAFYVTLFLMPADKNIPAEPVFILDAQSLQVYEEWNNLKTIAAEAGGFGGNEHKQLVYDGSANNLAKLAIDRNPATQVCLLKNPDVSVFDFAKIGTYDNVEKSLLTDTAVMSFICNKTDPRHNNVYWNENFDNANGGYSPSNDALYAGSVIQDMYKSWYNVPMLKNPDETPMVLKMLTHILDPAKDKTTPDDTIARFNEYENAFWSDYFKAIFLGDGGKDTYPLTSLGIIGHEVSHGFTAQHSNLVYKDQSGSLNESFSDMAAITAEFYSTGHIDGTIGTEIMKKNGEALRYMDQPSKDCDGREPGNACSIDTAEQYATLDYTSRLYTQKIKKKEEQEAARQSYIVHLGSGVFNRVFYIISNSPDWDPKKAFGVMVQANSNYWTQTSNYAQAACGVLKATKDFNYNTSVVTKAFDKVGLSTRECH